MKLSDDQARAVEASRHVPNLTLKGPRLSGRTTALLHVGMQAISDKKIASHKLWVLKPVRGPVRHWETLLEPYPSLRLATVGSVYDLCRGLLQELTLSTARPQEDYLPSSVRDERRLIQENITRKGWLKAFEAEADRLELRRIPVRRDLKKSELDERRIRIMLERRPALFLRNRLELILAGLRLADAGDAAFYQALTQRCGLLLVDDLEGLTVLERMFVEALKSFALKTLPVSPSVFVTEEARTHASSSTPRTQQGTVMLSSRFVRAEVLLLTRHLYPKPSVTEVLSATGFGGRVNRPEFYRVDETTDLEATLRAALEERVCESVRQGRRVGVVSAHVGRDREWEIADLQRLIHQAIGHLDSHQLMRTLWGGVDEGLLLAALRFVCRVSSFSGGHPLLDSVWLQSDLETRYIKADERSAIHRRWQDGELAKRGDALFYDEARFAECRTTLDVVRACLSQESVSPSSPSFIWAAAHPDPAVALTVLTAARRRPPVVVDRTSLESWDDLYLILPERTSQVDHLRLRAALHNTRERVQVILIASKEPEYPQNGSLSPHPYTATSNYWKLTEYLTECFLTETPSQAGVEQFLVPSGKPDLQKFSGLFERYLHSHWPGHVRTDVLLRAQKRAGELSPEAWENLREASLSWHRRRYLLSEYGVPSKGD